MEQTWTLVKSETVDTGDYMDSTADINDTAEIITEICTCTCCPVHASQAKEYLDEIVKNQIVLQGMVSQVMEDMRKLKVSSIVVDNDVKTSIFNYFDCPLQSEEDMIVFEQYLCNEEKFTQTVEELSRVGGANPYDFIKRVLSRLLSNLLASEYSWYGAKQKKIFGKLQISQLIIQAGLKSVKGATAKDLEEATKNWLRRAKERAEKETKKKQELLT